MKNYRRLLLSAIATTLVALVSWPAPSYSIAPDLSPSFQPITPANASQIEEVLKIENRSAADSSQAFALAFSPNSKTLLTTGNDDTLQLWDVSSGKTVGQPIPGISPAAFSPDGQTIAFFDATSASSVHLWDLAAAKDSRPPLTGGLDDVNSLAFSPDGKTLAMGSADNLVRLWDVATGKQRFELHQTSDSSGTQDFVGSISSVAFSPDGKTLATTLCRDIVDTDCRQGDVEVWDTTTGKMIGVPLSGHSDWVASVAFSPDGKVLASGGWDSTIRLWDTSNRSEVGILQGHTDSVVGLAFSPDSQILLSGSWDNTVKVWDVSNEKPLVTLSGHKDSVIGVAFSPDGRLIASAGQDGMIRLWAVRA